MQKIPMQPANRTVLREPALEGLRSFITPTSQHFVLAALGIPRPRPGEWSLTIGGAVRRREILSLDELCALPSRTLTVTVECAGDPYDPDKPKRRVSTAKWRGVPLNTVLASAEPLTDATHVWIDGADWGVYRAGTKNAERANEYRKDLPIERVARGDVLLAYEMNDAPLPPEHGYPLRVIVPGFYGTNSVKWVNNLIVAHGRPYTLFSATLYNIAEIVDGAVERRQVGEIRVNSMLTNLRNGDVIPVGTHPLAGWAWGANEVARVQLRVDEQPWFDAKVGSRVDSAWQSFESTWNFSAHGCHVISVRATDCFGNTQPNEVHINQIATTEITVR